MPAIHAADLRKRFGKKTAVENISLTVPKGTIHALLGPNGAGKTTLVKMLATLLKPDSGKAEIMGHDIVHEADLVRSHISLTGQSASVDEELTGFENLYLVARLYGYRPARARQRARDLLSSFELEEAASRLVKNYSGGMRRRLDIAASIVRIPDVLFLDEPTTGLDPRSRNNLWAVIKGLAKMGTTIVLTTQYLEEADYLADRISVIDKGRVISEGTSDELKASVGKNILHFSFEANGTPISPEMTTAMQTALGESAIVHLDDRKASVPVSGTAQALEVLANVSQSNGVRISNFSLSRPNLDEVFLALTGSTAEGGGDEVANAGDEPSGKGTGKQDINRIIDVKDRPERAGILVSKLMFGWRSMLKIKHIPEQFVDALITPVMFTFMFTFLFGGALAGSIQEYLQFFIPGIFVQTLAFNAVYAGININSDITKGVYDRFRSMPIWLPSPLAGMFVGDSFRHIVSGSIVLLLGVVLGFRLESGFLPLLAAFALVLFFALSLAWAFVILGLSLRSVSAVMSVGWLVMMPIVFMSNIFADPATMPVWLQTVITYNPLAWQVDAVRGLLAGQWNYALVGKALAASAVITLVLAPIAIMLYKRER